MKPHSPYGAEPECPRMSADIGRTLHLSIAVKSTGRTHEGAGVGAQLGLWCQSKEIYESTISLNWCIALDLCRVQKPTADLRYAALLTTGGAL